MQLSIHPIFTSVALIFHLKLSRLAEASFLRHPI